MKALVPKDRLDGKRRYAQSAFVIASHFEIPILYAVMQMQFFPWNNMG
ncbi:MAG: hypothetical protein JJT76_17735 [Clostridiaceae bacterium]|nr:hypothetical protein [Clostridiaceae bacterium]